VLTWLSDAAQAEACDRSEDNENKLPVGIVFDVNI